MDDQTLETLCSSFDHAVTLSHRGTADQTLGNPVRESEQLEEKSDSVETSCATESTPEISSCQGKILPIFWKIEDLSNKVKDIRKDYTLLREEVKSISVDSLLESETFAALSSLGIEHEILKSKYQEECESLRKKYLEECTERKKLYNEVIELKGNIRVFCRCRPLKQDEIANGSTSVVNFDSCQQNELQIISSDSSKKAFKFDHVFKLEDDQGAVFAQTLPLVTSVLDGYNVCIFAYGQTGTGKTYTMEGTPENRGVNYRTLEELFSISEKRSSIMKYELFVSMLEVYNEKIRDLLADNSNQPAKKLEIKQSAEGTQEVPGLVEARVYSTDEVWGLLKSGSEARSVGSTNCNELSSRSHCLLRVTVVGKNSVTEERTRSHLWLVDLAGSERVSRTEVEGDRLRESQFINKSLSALGDVISSLASKASHVPYRNSKLTHILQSSLGGDCKTLMFVQISPNAADLGETLCSLNFASRVRGVEHGPARRQPDNGELLKYKQLAEKAKQDEKETKKLHESVQSLQSRLASREQICKTLTEKVQELEKQLAEERKLRLKQQNKALASISSQPTFSVSNQAPKQQSTDKKPPLAPPNFRLPLRRINNLMPMPHTAAPPPKKNNMSFLPSVNEARELESKENMARPILKARRGSLAVVKPTPPATSQVFQPRRRASFATFRHEPNSTPPIANSSRPTAKRVWTRSSLAPLATIRPESNSTVMTTPLHSSSFRLRGDRMRGRSSLNWDPQQLQSSREAMEETPVGYRNSNKFRGSPTPSRQPQVGSWKPKHPTVIALQKKHLVWSPLKLKGMKSKRNSFVS